VDGNTKILVGLAAAAPALIAMLVFDYLDRKRPEPRSLRWKVAIAGALSVVPVLFVDAMLISAAAPYTHPGYTYNGALFQSFGVAAAVEELFKILVIYWIVWRRPEFDERMDGIVYGARAGLGFALLENVAYLLNQPDMDAVIRTGILRAVLAVPGHAMWSAMIGYSAARMRFDRKGIGFLGGYLLAVGLHGLYDYAIFAHVPMTLEGNGDTANLLFIAPPAIIILCVLIVRRMARIALALDDADHARLGIPPPGPGPVGTAI
jgi:RsiW-degrading membrane proteinase PrsW (M82 family)